MRELRLVPGAATAWLAVIAVLLGGRGWAIFIIAAVVGCCLIARQWGQALFSGMVATAAALVAAVRQARAAAFDLGTEVTGRLTTAPTQTSTGGWLLKLKVPGYPTQLPVFSPEPVPAAAGAELKIRVRVGESDRAGVGKLSATATDVQVTGEPEGLAGWAAHVSDTFRVLVVDTVGPSSQGLIPGMVLGDTCLLYTSPSPRDRG